MAEPTEPRGRKIGCQVQATGVKQDPAHQKMELVDARHAVPARRPARRTKRNGAVLLVLDGNLALITLAGGLPFVEPTHLDLTVRRVELPVRDLVDNPSGMTGGRVVGLTTWGGGLATSEGRFGIISADVEQNDVFLGWYLAQTKQVLEDFWA